MEKPRKFINDSLAYILLECPYPVTVNNRHKEQFKKAVYSKYFEVSAGDRAVTCALQQTGSEVVLTCVCDPGPDRRTCSARCGAGPEETLEDLLSAVECLKQ